jgi:hypothetical protein
MSKLGVVFGRCLGGCLMGPDGQKRNCLDGVNCYFIHSVQLKNTLHIQIHVCLRIINGKCLAV